MRQERYWDQLEVEAPMLAPADPGISMAAAAQSAAAEPKRVAARRTKSACVRPPRKADSQESDLVRRLKSGDPAALEAIFNLYSAKLYNVARRILGEDSDTEEVIQDVFWTVFRKAKSFQGHARFSTWLYRLTVNAALGKIRRSKKTKEVAYDEYLPKFQDDGHHKVRPVVDWSESLEEKYARRELQKILGDALDQLKPLDKAVVVLSDLEGLPDSEIATSVGLTVSAVKTRLHRARLFLRGKLAIRLGHSAA